MLLICHECEMFHTVDAEEEPETCPECGEHDVRIASAAEESWLHAAATRSDTEPYDIWKDQQTGAW